MSYINVILTLYLMFVISTIQTSFSDIEFEDENIIRICCAWGEELSDAILTFSVKGESNKQDAVEEAIKEWNKKISIKIDEIPKGGNIEINFRDDGNEIAGQTVNYFDSYGFIRKSIIIISSSSNDYEFDVEQIEQITKHEIGHALGLGHANFDGNLMTELVNSGTGRISKCEVEAVEFANAWKTQYNNIMPYYPEADHIECES